MNTHTVLSLVLVAIFVQGLEGIQVQKCAKGILPEVTLSVEGTECVQSPCKIKEGSKLDTKMKFNAPSDLAKLKPQVVAAGKTYPIGDDACPDIINTKCPISKGGLVVYEKSLPIRKTADGPVPVLMALVDATNSNIVTCFIVKIDVTN